MQTEQSQEKDKEKQFALTLAYFERVNIQIISKIYFISFISLVKSSI